MPILNFFIMMAALFITYTKIVVCVYNGNETNLISLNEHMFKSYLT